MNLLWLDLAERTGKYDSWLHTDFAIALRPHVANLYLYAPHMDKKYDRSLVPFLYDPRLPIANIVSSLKIDVIVANTRSAMYHAYYPRTICPEKPFVGHCWLPEDFASCRTPKICIEEDFHYETDAVWHKQMGFRVLLQKHYSQSLRRLEVPCESFPFSVDTAIFNPGRHIRKNKICFSGSAEAVCYPQRYHAYTMLEGCGLLDAFVQRNGTREKNTAVYGMDYVNCLKNYISHVSCGSKYDLTSAKNFEIMSSGSVLFTNKFIGIEKQLDEGSYVTYENNWSDLFAKTDKILNDVPFRAAVVNRAIHCIQTRHTHEIRIKEFLKLIEKYR